jgi:hypothetical protein
MNFKALLTALSLIFVFNSVDAQQNKLLITYDSGKTASASAGESVRLSYPTAKLVLKNGNKISEFLGLRGKIDSISKSTIYLKVDKRSPKNIALDINQILSIKKISGIGTFLTFLTTSAILGTGAVLLTNQLETSSVITVFAGVFSLIPAGIITANVFYPSKPHNKVGDGYQLKIITIAVFN